jgi:hypothetical protein
VDSKAAVARFEAAVTGQAALTGGVVDARLPYQKAEAVLRDGGARAPARQDRLKRNRPIQGSRPVGPPTG